MNPRTPILACDLARELGVSIDEVKARAKRICSDKGFDSTYVKVHYRTGKEYMALTQYAANEIRQAAASAARRTRSLSELARAMHFECSVSANTLAVYLNCTPIHVINTYAEQFEDINGDEATYVPADDGKGGTELELTPDPCHWIGRAVAQLRQENQGGAA